MLLKISVFVLTFFNTSVHSKRNNVCTTYASYFVKDISNECYYCPDLFQTVPAILERHAGVSETHNITTEDGFILTTFRIPRENPRGVILMQHPLLVDANIWVNQDNYSTALLFWERGYDVWLGNNRGNYYAKHHKNLTTKDEKFWDWSFHEMGLYDHDAVLNYISERTNKSKVIFVTHSMSGTSSLIYASLKPDEAAEKIKIIINIAPIVHLKYVRSPIKLVSPFEQIIQATTKAIKMYSLLNYDLLPLVLRFFVIEADILKPIIAVILCLTCGCTLDNYDPVFYNMMLSEFTSEVSWKTLFHYMQFVNSKGRFQMYDYGPAMNLKKYGHLKPPEYPLKNVKVPNYLIYSKSDSCSTAEDNKLLIGNLPKEAIAGTVEIEGINHIEFHYARDRISKVYEPILSFLEDFGKK